MRLLASIAVRLGRAGLIVLLVIVGSAALVRYAPGYLSDAREMDSRYAGTARAELSEEASRSGSWGRIVSGELRAWMRGGLGMSRQYAVPVMELIRPRLAVTGGLMLRSIVSAWSLALTASILASVGRNPSRLWQLPSTVLLAVPTAALATVCLLADAGGPVLTMTLLLAARDYKFLDALLRAAWRAPHLLMARAQGIGTRRLLLAYVLPGVLAQLSALATLSILTALGAVVPVEVLFNLPGVGQLAWNAALNRDIPVLLAVTALMAMAVTCAGMMPSLSAEAGEVL